MVIVIITIINLLIHGHSCRPALLLETQHKTKKVFDIH